VSVTASGIYRRCQLLGLCSIYGAYKDEYGALVGQ